MQNVIFYFTGTGNSLQLAQGIAEVLGNCEVINIAKHSGDIPTGVERAGFVFLVYFGGLPGIAHAFLKNLSIQGDPYLFCVANCGGSSGVFLKQTAHYLRQKGKTLQAGTSILMPENFILLYDRFGEERERMLFTNAEQKIAELGVTIRGKQAAAFEYAGNVPFRYVGGLFNRAFIGLAAGLDRHFHISDRCIGCGKCERICGVGNIVLRERKPVWNHHCELCMGCINVCPVKSIDFGRLTQKKERYINPNVTLL